MNTKHITDQHTSLKKKKIAPLYGMHPGGGFVAWPDGSTTTTVNRKSKKTPAVCRGYRRRGFVAWPVSG